MSKNKSCSRENVNEFSPALKLYYKLIDKGWDKKKFICGRLLTVIDACISDPEQRKGIKDLITQAYWPMENENIEKDIIQQFFVKYIPSMIDLEETVWSKDSTSAIENYFPTIN